MIFVAVSNELTVRGFFAENHQRLLFLPHFKGQNWSVVVVLNFYNLILLMDIGQFLILRLIIDYLTMVELSTLLDDVPTSGPQS